MDFINMRMMGNNDNHLKTVDADVQLRSKINKLLGDFARKYGLKAVDIVIEPNPWYKGDKDVPMFSIGIVYKPCYKE